MSEDGGLIPIDHGLSFPKFVDLANISFDWLYYPQAKMAFSSQVLKEIEAIDVNRDLMILKALGMSWESQLNLFMSTTILKLAAKAGKTLYEIGSMLQRKGDRSLPSDMEKLFSTSVQMMESSSLGMF